jgi:hypothetical protein
MTETWWWAEVGSFETHDFPRILASLCIRALNELTNPGSETAK